MTADETFTFTNLPRKRSPVPARVNFFPLIVVVFCSFGAVLAIGLAHNELPAQIAHHWGIDGRPDAFLPLAFVLIIAGGLSFMFPLVLILLGKALKTERQMGTVATGMSACIATMAVTSVYGQRGMTESTAAKIDVAMWAGLGAGIAVGILTWLVVRQPRSALKVATAPLPDGAITFDLGPDDRLAWAGYAPVSNVMRALFGIIMVVMGSLALVFLYYGQKSLTALMLVLMLLVGLSLLFLLFAACSPVTIDTRGVRVIALGVIRWVDIPLSNIEGASVTMVSPLGDFGGWGKRVAFDGSQEGFVTIEGPAIRVTRAGERPCLISVNDAETAAATLNTLVKRRREGYPRS